MTELIALKDPEEIESLFENFKNVMTSEVKGKQIKKITIRYPKGSEVKDVFWQPALNIWCYFDPHWAWKDNYYGCIFGIGEPKTEGSNNITLQINYNNRNLQKRIAGRFLKDKNNKFWIGHSGKLGGGSKGRREIDFFDFCNCGNPQSIEWIDGTPDDVIVIGAIDDEFFPAKIAEYIKQVASFKENRQDKIKVTKIPNVVNDKGYTPEPSGQITYSQEQRTIIAYREHGDVVNRLKKDLEKIGYQGLKNDRTMDLFIPSDGNEGGILFEVKTDLTTTSIYTAIGQLMFYGARQNKPPRRIMVLPATPTKDTKKILSSLNIEILIYDKGEEPFFKFGKMFEK